MDDHDFDSGPGLPLDISRVEKLLRENAASLRRCDLRRGLEANRQRLEVPVGPISLLYHL